MAYNYDNQVRLAVWAKKNGVFSRVDTITVAHSAQTNNGGVQTLGWSATRGANLGPIVETIGLSIDSSDNGTAVLNTFNLAQWTSMSAGSGERSATPSGQTTTVTVQP